MFTVEKAEREDFDARAQSLVDAEETLDALVLSRFSHSRFRMQRTGRRIRKRFCFILKHYTVEPIAVCSSLLLTYQYIYGWILWTVTSVFLSEVNSY